jgi:hypothetical protein
MNKFILQIIKRLLLMLLLLSAYIFLVDIYFDAHDRGKLFNNDLESTEIVITGTSHTLWGLDPTLFEFKTINISETNKPTIIDLEIIKKYHKKMPKLEYVIIPIDYFTLFYTGDSDVSVRKYWHHWGLKNKNAHLFHFVDCEIETPLDLLVSNRRKLSNFEQKEGTYNPEDDMAKMLDRIDAWHTHWMSLKNYALITREIIQFINFCKSKEIKIVFVKMPIPISTQRKFNNRYMSITSTSLKNFGEFSNVYLIDLNKIPVFENDSLFHDCDHLNYRGAKLASSILNNRIISIANMVNDTH